MRPDIANAQQHAHAPTKSGKEKSGLSFNVKRRLKFGWLNPLHRSSVRPRPSVHRVEDGVMRSLKVALFAGAAIAAAFTPANAADLGPIMQAPQMIAPVQVQEQMGGWYLRGDIGVGSQK